MTNQPQRQLPLLQKNLLSHLPLLEFLSNDAVHLLNILPKTWALRLHETNPHIIVPSFFAGMAYVLRPVLRTDTAAAAVKLLLTDLRMRELRRRHLVDTMSACRVRNARSWGETLALPRYATYEAKRVARKLVTKDSKTFSRGLDTSCSTSIEKHDTRVRRTEALDSCCNAKPPVPRPHNHFQVQVILPHSVVPVNCVKTFVVFLDEQGLWYHKSFTHRTSWRRPPSHSFLRSSRCYIKSSRYKVPSYPIHPSNRNDVRARSSGRP